jgi:transcriptional regulator with XRE-family HTH domain
VAENPWQQQVEALGHVIRTQRKLAKLSLRELAALTDLSNAYLSQLERGLHQPSIRVLMSLADAFKLSTETILEQAGILGEDEPTTADVEAAIRADSRLSDSQKEALLGVYRGFVETGESQ